MKSESQYIAENIKLCNRIQELERLLFIANQKINEQNKEILSLREQLDIKMAKIFAPRYTSIQDTSITQHINFELGIFFE